MPDHPKKPRRLQQLFQTYSEPIYFVTFNTFQRKRLLANNAVQQAFITFAAHAQIHGAAFGDYVIMPDHLHCFIRTAPSCSIGTTIRLLKRALSSAIRENTPPHWQPGFFDHLVRNGESYSQKWEYVQNNPVRAGLVESSQDWPYIGRIIPIRY